MAPACLDTVADHFQNQVEIQIRGASEGSPLVEADKMHSNLRLKELHKAKPWH